MEISIHDNAINPIAEVLVEGLKHYNEAYIASAFVTEGGLGVLRDELRQFTNAPQKKLTVVTGDYLNFTKSDALDELEQLGRDARKSPGSARVRVKYLEGVGSRHFHPKVYLFTGEGKALLVVGSGNLTEAGLEDNIEAYVRVSGSSDDPVFKVAQDLIERWAKSGGNVTKAILEKLRQKECEDTQYERLLTLQKPFLNASKLATQEDYILLCNFNRTTSGQPAFSNIEEKLFLCARVGRVVELRLSHANFWLSLPSGWFNADKPYRKNQRIHSFTQIGYDLFDKADTEKLKELEDKTYSGSRDYGWKTSGRLFVPECKWSAYQEWFTTAQHQYCELAESILGHEWGRLGRTKQGLPEAVTVMWRQYNGRKPVQSGLKQKAEQILRERLDEIKNGSRLAYRFESVISPHPVVAWAALLPGIWGIKQDDETVSNALAELGLANLHWLASKLTYCPADRNKWDALSVELREMNVLGFCPVSKAVDQLQEYAARKADNRIKPATWQTRQEEIRAQGRSLLDEIDLRESTPGNDTLKWLAELTIGRLG